MLYPGDLMFFLQPSTDHRKDFKLPALTVVSTAKNDLKDTLDKIIEGLDLNLKQMLMSKDDRAETKPKN